MKKNSAHWSEVVVRSGNQQKRFEKYGQIEVLIKI